MYLTGDIGVYDSKNKWIEYHGRNDRQIKLGGVRIELDEIEHIIREQNKSSIRDIIVIFCENSLVGVIVHDAENAKLGKNTDELKDNDENISKFVEGIELTEKQIITIFEKFKIEKVESLDANFDPNMHQAMFEVESEDKEPGTVVEVVQEGYKIGERLLRPALVGVSKKKS